MMQEGWNTYIVMSINLISSNFVLDNLLTKWSSYLLYFNENLYFLQLNLFWRIDLNEFTI